MRLQRFSYRRGDRAAVAVALTLPLTRLKEAVHDLRLALRLRLLRRRDLEPPSDSARATSYATSGKAATSVANALLPPVRHQPERFGGAGGAPWPLLLLDPGGGDGEGEDSDEDGGECVRVGDQFALRCSF